MKLKEARTRAGLTQRELGARIRELSNKEVTSRHATNMVSLWERGKPVPLEFRAIVREALGLTETELWLPAKRSCDFEELLGFLSENGLSDEDQQLIRENKLLRDALPGLLARSVSQRCEGFRTVVKTPDPA